MPKIVDHEKYREELATKAAEVFVQKGYHAVGMRTLAGELGLSKSALYHYFPSKQSLFEAATEVAVGGFTSAFPAPGSDNPSLSERVECLVTGLRVLDQAFKGELALLVDYLRDLSAEEVESDPAMQWANNAILASIQQITGEEAAKPALLLCYGFLLQRLFDGGSSDFAVLKSALEHLLE